MFVGSVKLNLSLVVMNPCISTWNISNQYSLTSQLGFFISTASLLAFERSKNRLFIINCAFHAQEVFLLSISFTVFPRPYASSSIYKMWQAKWKLLTEAKEYILSLKSALLFLGCSLFWPKREPFIAQGENTVHPSSHTKTHNICHISFALLVGGASMETL